MSPSTKSQITEVKTFSCPQLPGISFQYPVFKGWEVKAVNSSQPDRCTIWLNWPEDIDFEVAPKVEVRKLMEPAPLVRKCFQNPYGIRFISEITTPSGDVACDFYIDNFTVRVAFNHGGPGFSTEIFWKQIIDTFRREDVTPINKERKEKGSQVGGEKPMAKRIAPPAIAPVTYRGIQYVALYDGVGGREASCSIVASDSRTGAQLWKTILYRIRYDKKKETDVQDVWPRSLTVEKDDLVVTNERDEVFTLNLTTGRLQIFEVDGKRMPPPRVRARGR